MKQTLVKSIPTKFYNSKVFMNNIPNLSRWIGGYIQARHLDDVMLACLHDTVF
jgi:hypothetical protein